MLDNNVRNWPMRSAEGHEISSREEAIFEILSHTSNLLTDVEPYTNDSLKKFTDVELVEIAFDQYGTTLKSNID